MFETFVIILEFIILAILLSYLSLRLFPFVLEMADDIWFSLRVIFWMIPKHLLGRHKCSECDCKAQILELVQKRMLARIQAMNQKLYKDQTSSQKNKGQRR